MHKPIAEVQSVPAAALNIRGLAARYGLSQRTVYSLIAQGELPPGFRLGRSRRWLVRELDTWDVAKFATSTARKDKTYA